MFVVSLIEIVFWRSADTSLKIPLSLQLHNERKRQVVSTLSNCSEEIVMVRLMVEYYWSARIYLPKEIQNEIRLPVNRSESLDVGPPSQHSYYSST